MSGEGSGWHRESRRHHDAAMKGRPTHAPGSGKASRSNEGTFTESMRSTMLKKIQEQLDTYVGWRDDAYNEAKAKLGLEPDAIPTGKQMAKIYRDKRYLEYTKLITKQSDFKSHIQYRGPGPVTAKEIIALEYGASKNFITPHVLKTGKLAPNVAYELSHGDGMMGQRDIYGVSVVRLNKDGTTTRSPDDLSKSFATRDQAESYIRRWKE